MKNTKIYALYLPQYYETNYNNDWWGKGYTEWTACKQAKPLYEKHYQPRLPLNNNFYDLSKKEEIVKQCRLAKKYGINGFVIYQYYSCNSSRYGKRIGKNGSMLLNVPTEIIRDNKDIDTEYCLYWANHDWRKAWFGQDPKMLWKQEYGTENDWKEYYEYNRDYFKDDRYIKIDNKPVFIIFAVWHFKDIKRFMSIWNELAINDGFSGIYFIKTEDAHTKKILDGFDAVYRREPFYTFANGFSKIDFLKRGLKRKIIPQFNKVLNKFGKGIITYKCDYEKLWRSICSNELNRFIIPGAIADWDNSARKGYNSQILLGVNEKKFKRYFSELLKKCQINDVPFVIINAWNEWAEGAYLEPDQRNRDMYLRKIKEILEES